MNRSRLLILVISLMIVCIGGYYYYSSKNIVSNIQDFPENGAPVDGDSSTGMPNPASVNCVQQGGTLSIQIDNNTGGEIGICNFSDGSSCEEWALMRGECQMGNPAAAAEEVATDVRQIEEALVAKENIDLTQMKVSINENTGTYVSGLISPINEEVGGGYLFAAKENGKWTIVATGNGQIECSAIERFPDFPTSMIPECMNADGTLKVREAF